MRKALEIPTGQALQDSGQPLGAFVPAAAARIHIVGAGRLYRRDDAWEHGPPFGAPGGGGPLGVGSMASALRGGSYGGADSVSLLCRMTHCLRA